MQNESEAERGFAPLVLAAIVLRRWKLVLLTIVTTTVVAVGATFLWPSTYVTGTVLVPFAGQSRSQLGLQQLPAGFAGLIGGAGAGSQSERMIGVILKSRTLSDSMAARLGRGPEQQAEIRRIVGSQTRVQRNTDGSIQIQVLARDPKLAAAVANAYPVLINRLLLEINADGAARKQRFLQSQLAAARERLAQSEERVLAFQRRSDAGDLPEQSRRTLDAAAALQTGIFEQERALVELRGSLAPGHPRLRAAEAALATQRAQLRRVTSGGGSAGFVSIGQGPALRVASTRLLRDFTKDEQIYTALTAALAEAQIDANNNLPVLSVLDSAPPGGSTRSLPSTLVLGFMLGVVLGVVLAFVSEAIGRVRRAPGNEPFFAAVAAFKRDLGLRPARGTGLTGGD